MMTRVVCANAARRRTPWITAWNGHHTEAFKDRLGWLWSGPPKSDSFREKQRAEDGLDPPSGALSPDAIGKTLERLNRPRSAPPKQRGSGRPVDGWVGPEGRLETIRYTALSYPQQEDWEKNPDDLGVKWTPSRDGLDISQRPRSAKGQGKAKQQRARRPRTAPARRN